MRRVLVLTLLLGAAAATAAYESWFSSPAVATTASIPRAEPRSAPPPVVAAPLTAPPPLRGATRAPVRFVPVSGEAPARVAQAEGDSKRVVVYLHGFCSDASTVTEWAPAVQPHATLIALHGELSCVGQPGRFRWGNDIRFIDYRIQRAIRSIGTALEHELDGANLTIVGYSEGATRAESLAWLYPERYRRAVLMSGPEPPAFEKVRRSERVAVLRGGREFRRTYRLTAEHFERAGLRSRFWELPGASHGELGPQALRVLGEVFDFVER